MPEIQLKRYVQTVALLAVFAIAGAAMPNVAAAQDVGVTTPVDDDFNDDDDTDLGWLGLLGLAGLLGLRRRDKHDHQHTNTTTRM